MMTFLLLYLNELVKYKVMVDESLSNVLATYLGVLVAGFLILYLYYFYRAISECRKTDLGVGLTCVLALFASPFIAMAFVRSTKKHSDRIVLTFGNDEPSVNLTQVIGLKGGLDNVVALTDINQLCWYCGGSLSSNQAACPSCSKKRRSYFIEVLLADGKTKQQIAVSRWQKIPKGSTAVSVKMRKSMDIAK
jgi:hypothetical protein